MMLVCCIPMIVIVLALVLTGAAGSGAILFALVCVGLMALMMVGMGHGDNGSHGPETDRSPKQ